MIDAAGLSQGSLVVRSQDFHSQVSEHRCGGWSSYLIGNDTQLVSLVQKAQNGQKEILAARGIHPTRAQYQVRSADAANRVFSGEFATAVFVERIGGILLDVWRILRSVEHVVCRIMHKQCPGAPGFLGKDG